MDMCIPIRIAHKHKTLCYHCTWWSWFGKDRATPCRHFPWTCLGVVPICVPCPHWVDIDAGYPGQGLAKSSLCRSHPAWVCLKWHNLISHFSSDHTLDTRFSMNIELRMHVPVHLNNERLHFIFSHAAAERLSPALMWLFFSHSASLVMYFVMMNY